jgi:methionyl aminopeptidase
MARSLIKTSSEIDAMRQSGAILAKILKHLVTKAQPGMSPKDLSIIASSELSAMGAEPVFLGYGGYPDVICISVNDQVQHAIPNKTPLKNGDIVNFDFGVRYKKMITDAGVTIAIGGKPLNDDDARLLNGTQLARDTAIEHLKAGVRVGDISAIIETILKNHKLGIVKELVGHGVGHQLHEDPEIPNYGKAGTGPILQAGMTVAIEPITTLGSPDIYIEKDGWTIKTWDGTRSAQFEHTVLILENGSEILTSLD